MLRILNVPFRVFRFYLQLALIAGTSLMNSAAQAWSAQVHSAIGEAVYQRLSAEERRYFIARIPSLRAERVTRINQLSAWADSIRDEPLASLIKGPVPASLRAFAPDPTRTWHYTNAYVLKTADVACTPANTGRLDSALVALDRALKEEKLDQQQEMLYLALLMHLLEDAHQPLHTSTRQFHDCESDRGGNLFCLRKHKAQCIFNLHQLWDGGFSTTSNSGIARLGDAPGANLPFPMLVNLILAEGQGMAEKVYGLDENRDPGSAYIAWASEVAASRISLSAHRVTRYLKDYYDYRHALQSR